jgi:hypothetical protein
MLLPNPSTEVPQLTFVCTKDLLLGLTQQKRQFLNFFNCPGAAASPPFKGWVACRLSAT